MHIELNVVDLSQSSKLQLTKQAIAKTVATVSSLILPRSERAQKPWGYIFPFDEPTLVDEPGYTNELEYAQWCRMRDVIGEYVGEAISKNFPGAEIELNLDQMDFLGGTLNIIVRPATTIEYIRINHTTMGLSRHSISADVEIA